MKVTTLTFPYKVLSAAYIDLNDNVTAPVLMEDEHTLTLSIDAYATQTINVTLDRA
jgi:hypothetical protein